MGGPDPEVNPFVTADMPNLSRLLGRDDWYLRGNGLISSERAVLVPTDPNLGVAGRPQSASGQATILTGRNVPEKIGKHYGPKPNAEIKGIIQEQNLFHELVRVGKKAALITPYPQAYFDAIESGKRMYSAVPLAVVSAGLPLFGEQELRQGKAVSPGFTGQGWREFLGYEDMPLISLHEAGQQIAAIAKSYDFSFFEHWPSDQIGHRGTLSEAVTHLQRVDLVIGGLLDAWDFQSGLLIITSDHGNIEEKDHRRHTRNPVPTILVGQYAAHLANQVHNLTDIAAIVKKYLLEDYYDDWI